ncbi:histidine phosphatase family protein [Streptomyces olivoreticuli]
MTVRVMLLSPAAGPAQRVARFDEDTPPDEAGLRRARAAAGALPSAASALTAPSGRCRATCAALGLEARPVPELRGPDMGRWRGLTLDEAVAAEPAGVTAWLTEPEAAPHGGESVASLVARVGAWLDALPEGRVLAVTEPGVVRAAVVHALGLAPEVFWRLDVAPLSLTELSGRSGRWNLRCGVRLDGA